MEYVRKFSSDMGLVSEVTPARRVKTFSHKLPRVLKWGQMKLLLGEIQWLTNHWNQREIPEIVLVVAGGAPGHHYQALSELFPGIIRIDLWDSNSFAEGLSENPRINLIKSRLYPKVARTHYKDVKNIFFVSDIRSVSHEMTKPSGALYTLREIEEGIWADHELQSDILEALDPTSALLKFRLPQYMPNMPWQPTQKQYLSGHIYVQAFTGQSSTETRIVPRRGQVSWETCLYSMKDYAEKLFYINSVLRNDYEVEDGKGNPVITIWQNSINESVDIPDAGELQNSFDAMLALDIMDRYLESIERTYVRNLEQRFEEAMCLWNWSRDKINQLMKNKFVMSQRRDFVLEEDEEKVQVEEVKEQEVDEFGN